MLKRPRAVWLVANKLSSCSATGKRKFSADRLQKIVEVGSKCSCQHISARDNQHELGVYAHAPSDTRICIFYFFAGDNSCDH